MPRVIYIKCPECDREFYVGREFFEIDEAYCHCPFCHREFNPQQAVVRIKFANVG